MVLLLFNLLSNRKANMSHPVNHRVFQGNAKNHRKPFRQKTPVKIHSLGEHEGSIFNKIIESKLDTLTDNEMKVLAGDRNVGWTKAFHAYLQTNNIEFDWPWKNSTVFFNWVIQKESFEGQLDAYNKRLDNAKLQKDKFNVYEGTPLPTEVTFTFDVSIEGVNFDGYESGGYNHEDVSIEKNDQSGLYKHYFSEDYIKNNKELWKANLRNSIKRNYSDDIRRTRDSNITLRRFIPKDNDDVYNSEEEYDFKYTDNSYTYLQHSVGAKPTEPTNAPIFN